MQITNLPVNRARELAPVYNSHVANVPLCAAVSPDTFSESISFNEPEASDRVHEQGFLVAIENGEPIGFAHVAVGRFPGPELHGDDMEHETGAIRFLTYARGNRAVGQALLEAAESYLRKRDVGRILACPIVAGYVFCRFGLGELSDRRSHIVALFGMNSYYIARGSVYLRSDDFEVLEPELPSESAEVKINRIPGERGCLPSVSITSKVQDQLICTCEIHSLAKWGNLPDSTTTFVFCDLEVEDPFQGQGWGRYLVLAALREARNIGYRHSVTSTDLDNYRAQLLYTNYGYDVVDTAYSFRKDFN